MKKTPRTTTKAPLLPIPVEGPFDRVGVDCVGPFPPSRSGNRYLVFSDYLTRWPEAFAVPCIKAPVIANLFINQIMARHGAPRTLLSDRGSGVARGGRRGRLPQAALFLEGGTFGWGGTLGFKYLMYYSNTDLNPQSTFASYQKCSKVLSECGKCHFRDPNFKKIQGRRAPRPPRFTRLKLVIHVRFCSRAGNATGQISLRCRRERGNRTCSISCAAMQM